MFAMFFLGALYLQEVLGYDPLQVGLAFSALDLVYGAPCRFATPSGCRCASARSHAPAGDPLDPGRAAAVRTGRRSTATTSHRPGPHDGPDRPGRRHRLPGADVPVRCRARYYERRGPRSGIGQCHRPGRRRDRLAVLATLATERTDNLLADGESRTAALNSGFHLALCSRGAGRVCRSSSPEGPALAISGGDRGDDGGHRGQGGREPSRRPRSFKRAAPKPPTRWFRCGSPLFGPFDGGFLGSS